MISLISSLSLKLSLNLLVHHRNILSLPRKSSTIFGNVQTYWKFSEILGRCSWRFVWPSEQFWKIFRNLQKVVRNLQKIKNAVISMYITERTLHVSAIEDINFMYSWQRTIALLFAALTREILFLALEHKIHIFLPLCNILYILLADICQLL